MIHKIVIASDSFKGSLTSAEVASILAEGIHCSLPDCEVCTVEIADGGEGTLEAIVHNTGGHLIHTSVEDPLGRCIDAVYGCIPSFRTSTLSATPSLAVIEMAKASGLPLLSDRERNPMLTSSYGTGQLILSALHAGYQNFLVGLGGSATNDGGTGMLSALGVRFFDAQGTRLKGSGQDLLKISYFDMDTVPEALKNAHFTVACDVDNPFYGPNGAAHVFSPQKGASSKMVSLLDQGLENLATVIYRQTGIDVQSIPGAGAAGGLGAAFSVFLFAQMQRGIEMVLDTVHFDELIADADLVITGEGRFDGQTAHGKTPWGVMMRARKYEVPVIVLAGSVAENASMDGYTGVYPIADNSMPLKMAMDPSIARYNLLRTLQQVLATLI